MSSEQYKNQPRDTAVIGLELLMAAGLLGYASTGDVGFKIAMETAGYSFIVVALLSLKTYFDDARTVWNTVKNMIGFHHSKQQPHVQFVNNKLNIAGFGTNTDRIFEHLDTQYYKSVMGRRV